MSQILEILEIGMMGDLKQMQSISHNLANSNTVGYKKQVSFQQAMDTAQLMQRDSGNSFSQQTAVNHQMGMLKHTGQKLDVAIEGKGYFKLADQEGNQFFTRNGLFSVDGHGNLVNDKGYTVLNSDNSPISLSTENPRIDKKGQIWENNQVVATLGIAGFKDPQSLQIVGSTLYKGDGLEQLPAEAMDGIRQGYVEASNVTPMDEMVKLITTTRHFEITQRAVKAYDEMLEKAVRTIGEF